VSCYNLQTHSQEFLKMMLYCSPGNEAAQDSRQFRTHAKKIRGNIGANSLFV